MPLLEHESKLLGTVEMAKPGIPVKKPRRREDPYIPNPMPERVRPVPADPMPVEPAKAPREPVPIRRQFSKR